MDVSRTKAISLNTSPGVASVAVSPVELHYNLEQIAIEFFIVGSFSGGHSECPKQNRPKSDYRKYPKLHKFNMAATESFVGLYLPNGAF